MSKIVTMDWPAHYIESHAEDSSQNQKSLTSPSVSMEILSLPSQILTNSAISGTMSDGVNASLSRNGNGGPQFDLAAKICAGMMELTRSIFASAADFVVFSVRPHLIFDSKLIERACYEVAFFSDVNFDWLCLCSDGVDMDGEHYCSAFFDREPTLLPSRGRRLVIQTTGTLVVVKMSVFRELTKRRLAALDPLDLFNTLIIVAAGEGIASFFSARLFPCLNDRKNIVPIDVESYLATLQIGADFSQEAGAALFPSELTRSALVRLWTDQLTAAIVSMPTFSFVIRTTFKRPDLLRRCLISIDYIRRSMNLPAEIVMATDIDLMQAELQVRGLEEEFPGLTFCIADGKSEQGFSRVRNLIAGIKATTSERVCIIDDDDFYTALAPIAFEEARRFGSEELVIFDAQVITERWTVTGVKAHRELLGYGQFFKASAWSVTLMGSNSIPLCAVIHPGDFVRRVVEGYRYSYDLSEDFAFHLDVFSHPNRPDIKAVNQTGAYQSHRVGDDNVSVGEDRTDWVLDTGNGLFELLFSRGQTFSRMHDVNAANSSGEFDGRLRTLEDELERSKKGQRDATRALARLVACLPRDGIL